MIRFTASAKRALDGIARQHLSVSAAFVQSEAALLSMRMDTSAKRQKRSAPSRGEVMNKTNRTMTIPTGLNGRHVVDDTGYQIRSAATSDDCQRVATD
jgi:hypothetical protein